MFMLFEVAEIEFIHLLINPNFLSGLEAYL